MTGEHLGDTNNISNKEKRRLEREEAVAEKAREKKNKLIRGDGLFDIGDEIKHGDNPLGPFEDGLF